MSKIKSYRDLKVWQKAHSKALNTINFIEELPKTMTFNVIANQLIRAITSISANIAEGHSSYRGKEYSRYLSNALRSAHEADNWLQLLKDSNKLNPKISLNILKQIEETNVEVIKMLTVLIKRLENR